MCLLIAVYLGAIVYLRIRESSLVFIRVGGVSTLKAPADSLHLPYRAVVILTEEDAEGATSAANRLREAVAAATLAAGGAVFSVTLSGGIGVVPLDGGDWDAVFAAADRRLYAAKEGGRNRVEGPSQILLPARGERNLRHHTPP